MFCRVTVLVTILAVFTRATHGKLITVTKTQVHSHQWDQRYPAPKVVVHPPPTPTPTQWRCRPWAELSVTECICGTDPVPQNVFATWVPTLITGLPCAYTSLLDPPETLTSTDTSNGYVYTCANYVPSATTCGDSTLVSTPTPTNEFDQPYCEAGSLTDVATEESQGGFLYFAYLVLLPNWQPAFDLNAASTALQGALSANSGCSTFDNFNSMAVGDSNTTLAAAFTASSITCTNWQMTQVISATTGGQQNTACNTGNIFTSDIIRELWQDGHPGEDPPFKRNLPGS